MPRKKRETRDTPRDTPRDAIVTVEAPPITLDPAPPFLPDVTPRKRGRPRKDVRERGDRSGERERARERDRERKRRSRGGSRGGSGDVVIADDDAPIAWRKWAAVGACVVFVLALLAWMRSVGRLHAATFDALGAMNERLATLENRPARVIVREIRSNGEIRETGPLPPPPSSDGAAS